MAAYRAIRPPSRATPSHQSNPAESRGPPRPSKGHVTIVILHARAHSRLSQNLHILRNPLQQSIRLHVFRFRPEFHGPTVKLVFDPAQRLLELLGRVRKVMPGREDDRIRYRIHPASIPDRNGRDDIHAEVRHREVDTHRKGFVRRPQNQGDDAGWISREMKLTPPQIVPPPPSAAGVCAAARIAGRNVLRAIERGLPRRPPQARLEVGPVLVWTLTEERESGTG